MQEAADAAAVRVSQAPYPARAIAWYATILLALLYWLSILDRFIIALLVDPIKHDLGLTDLQFGLLQGIAFAGTFAIFGLACGALADRYSRRWVIFAGVSIWSLATAACGFAQNFWHLLLARVGVGAAEAALNPSATSLLTDLFPPQRLTFAMAVYSMGSTVGAGSAFLIGGAIVGLVAQLEPISLPFVGELRPWQVVFFIVGVPGALLSFSIFTVPEPVRRGPRSLPGTQRSWFSAYRELFNFIKSQRRFFVCHYVGFAFASTVVVGGASWYPVHMSRSFGWSTAEVGLYLGLTLAAAAIVGKLAAGHLIDMLYQRGMRDAQLRWYVGCLLAAIPAGIVAMTSTHPWVFLGGLGLYLVLLQPLPVCAFTALNLVTPSQLRGTGVALFTATSGLIGGGLGPVLIPAAARYIFRDESAIGQGMAVVIAVCCPIAAVSLALGLRGMRAAIAASEQST